MCFDNQRVLHLMDVAHVFLCPMVKIGQNTEGVPEPQNPKLLAFVELIERLGAGVHLQFFVDAADL